MKVVKVPPLVEKQVRTPKVFRWPRLAIISARTANTFTRTLKNYSFDIPSQVSSREYRKFVLGFKPVKCGSFTLDFTRGSPDGAMVLAFTKTAKRSIAVGNESKLKKSPLLFKLAKKVKLNVKSRLFKIKFILTRTIEPELKLPINRTSEAGICAITNVIGPSTRKYGTVREFVEELNNTLGGDWQNYLLSKVITHSKSQGCSAVALLRPEFNPDLTKEHLIQYGAKPEDVESIRSQYYAAARKTGFKKIKGSKYFWIFF